MGAAQRPTRAVTPDVAPPEPENITANERAFTVLVRNALFRRVELAALRRADDLAALDETSADDWRASLDAYFAEHEAIDTGPDARGPRMLVIEKDGRSWQVQQILGDPAGDHDWRIVASVDLDASDDEGELVMEVVGLVQL